MALRQLFNERLAPGGHLEQHEKKSTLLNNADDVRRLALDALDDRARQTNTWGTQEHRSARAAVERTYDQNAARLNRLESSELDAELERQKQA